MPVTTYPGNAGALNGTPIATTEPTDQQVLRYVAADGKYEPGAVAGAGDLLAANNLSDVASASTARTNLGLAIGTNVQAYAAQLATTATWTTTATAIQTISAAGATAIDVTKRTCECDLATAANNVTSSLPDGSYVGQRLTLVLITLSISKTWVITPVHFSYGKSTITLVAAQQAVELEWQGAGGWHFVGGTTGLLA